MFLQRGIDAPADGRLPDRAFVPDLGRFDRGRRFAVSRIEPQAVWFEAGIHDAASQVVDSRLVRLATDGVRLFPTRLRYAWPSELGACLPSASCHQRPGCR